MINIKIFSLLVRHHCDHVDAGETWKKENHGNRILFNFSLLLSSIYLFWKVRVKFLNCFDKVMSPFSWKEMFKMITRLSMAPCFLYWSGKVIAEFEIHWNASVLIWLSNSHWIHLQSLSFSHLYSQFVLERHQINLAKPWKNLSKMRMF